MKSRPNVSTETLRRHGLKLFVLIAAGVLVVSLVVAGLMSSGTAVLGLVSIGVMVGVMYVLAKIESQ